MKKKSVIFFIGFLLISFLSVVMFYGYVYVNAIAKMDAYPYRLSDETYISIQHESELFQGEDSPSLQANFLSLNKELNELPSATYYEFYQQPLFYGENQIQSVQIGLNVQDDMSLQVQSGRLFNQLDYIFEAGKPIPVILGSQFQEHFRVGDQFQAEYLFVPYTFQVIGFLSPNSTVTFIDQHNLDNCVVMPSGQFVSLPKTKKQEDSQLIHTANRASGILKVEGNTVEVCNEVIKLLDHADVGEFSYYSNSTALDYLMQGVDIWKLKTICITGTFIFVIATALILYCMKKRNFSLSPTSRKTFIIMTIVAFVIAVIASLCIVKAVLHLEFINLIIMRVPLLVSACYYGVVLFYVNKHFYKHDKV